MVIHQIPEEAKHRTKVMDQIQRCDQLFSGFNAAPTIVNAYTEKIDFKAQAHEGKKIALAVLVLYAEIESIIPKEFYDHFEKIHRKEKAFGEPFQFLSEDPYVQFKGILKIWFFYKELLNAIWSLPEFSDVKLHYHRRDIDIFNLDEEAAIFPESYT